MIKRRGCKAGWRGALVALVCAFIQWPAAALSIQSEADVPALAQRWLTQALPQQAARSGQPVRLHATLGALDSRLRLAACARVEVYLPPGNRLWGSTRLGLRCLEGPTRWNVTLPVKVQATGLAWVLRRDVAPGATLQDDDLMQAEVDWAAEASPVLDRREAWRGQVAARALQSGQTLRQNMVRPAQVFQAGATVRVLVDGGSFQVSAQGQALTPGLIGQQARVRVESGRVMSGRVLDEKTVLLEI